MNLENALNIVSKEYEVEKAGANKMKIKVQKLLDENSFYCVYLVENDGKVKLSDLSFTCDVLDFDADVFESICQKHNAEFVEWTIEKEFNDISDLYKFIKILDELANLNN